MSWIKGRVSSLPGPVFAALLAALMVTGYLAPPGPAAAETLFPPDLFGGPFELTRGDGETVRDTDFLGSHLLIYFGYTFCPDICPGDLSRLAHALDMLPGEDATRVSVLFITVDPDRDTPEIASAYARAFHPEFIGLSGSGRAIAAAVDAFRVHRVKVAFDGAGADDYLVSHSPSTYLMGPDGGFLTLFPHDTDPERITRVLRRYLVDPEPGA